MNGYRIVYSFNKFLPRRPTTIFVETVVSLSLRRTYKVLENEAADSFKNNIDYFFRIAI